MKIQSWPKTKSGKISITFVSVSITLFIVIIAVAANLENKIITGGFFGSIPFALTALYAFACAVISFISGLISTFKYKEKSILVLICLAICLFIMYLGVANIVGEITGIH